MGENRWRMWAIFGAMIMVGSALVIGAGAAAGLHGAAAPSSPPTSSYATPSLFGTNYTVTFTETGLPAGSNWSVQVCITNECDDDGGALFQSSNGSSISFSLANGTYFFQVPEVNETDAQPGQGSFTVAGASPAPIAVHFGPPTLYTVTFVETGLAAGTNWSVALGGYGGQNAQGNQSGNGSQQDLGLFAGGFDGWGDGFNMTNNSTLTLSLPNGSYSYTVFNVTNYSIVGPSTGSLNVSGASPAPIQVTFAAAASYPVTFVEQGLANGTNWTVELHGMSSWGAQGNQWGGDDDGSEMSFQQTTATSSMAFNLLNGTYRFHVEEVDGYAANFSSGRLNVSGGPVTIQINFTALPTYNVTFNESGLPNGTDWGLKIFGHTGRVAFGHPQRVRQTHASPGLVSFHLPSGKYHYKLIPLSGWKTRGGFGGRHFKIASTSVHRTLVFEHRRVAFPAAPAGPGALALSPSTSLLSEIVASVRGEILAPHWG